MIEPTYNECDEDGNEYRQPNQAPWKSIVGMGYQPLLLEAFRLCSYGNKRNFGSPWEHKTWKTICKKLDKGVIPEEWVEEQLKVVKDKNKDRIRIVFVQFETMVLNIERQKDWEAKDRIARGEVTDFIEEESRDFTDQA